MDSVPSYNDTVGSTLVRDDGRVDIEVNSRLFRTLSRLVPPTGPPPPYSEDPDDRNTTDEFPLKLCIVIQVVGSRGDIQPFVALGCQLQKHGHRVRVATHNVFETFVRDSGLEFYPIGGNPSELMAYMVKNPGLIPSLKTVRRGEIQKKRQMVAEMLRGCWQSCLQPDIVSGKPFVADAIIANPPSFAHIHCAQALGIPMHLMFTMPWSSTGVFSHPLANIKLDQMSGIKPEIANYASYRIIEWLTWQGLGDVVNDWRKSIDLEPVPASEGPLLHETLKVPFTYCWSPALVEKPLDWPSNVDVCGFVLRQSPEYKPSKDIVEFLELSERPPVYIGFGSIVIDNPEGMTKTLIEATRMAGTRAIISRGWSNLGGLEDPDVLFIGDCPHEWLFSRVAAVVHHGGAGTTACGLINGRPTTVVPFFGDQPFWGSMVAAAGAGPQPIHHKSLNVENLTRAIKFCLSSKAYAAVGKLAEKMKSENGVANAVRSFHANLPLRKMQCEILRDEPASWIYTRHNREIRLSRPAVAVLLKHLRIEEKKIKMNLVLDVQILNRRWDPITGTASSLAGTGTDMAKATADIIVKPVQALLQGSARAESTDNLLLSHQQSHSARRNRATDPQSAEPKMVNRSCMATTGALVVASASGVGGFFKAYGKGFYLDLPLAVTEGFRAAPRLYGEEVPDHEPINDWQSGARVAGQNFVTGISDGVTGLLMQPYKGGVDGGALGAAKGIGKGLAGFVAKTASAGVGIVAYPSHGIYQSVRFLVKSSIRKQVVKARLEEGEYRVHDQQTSAVDVSSILTLFKVLAEAPVTGLQEAV